MPRGEAETHQASSRSQAQNGTKGRGEPVTEWHSGKAADRSWTGRSWPEDGGSSKDAFRLYILGSAFGAPGTVQGPRDVTVTKAQALPSRALGRGHSPDPRKEAAEEESAVTLDER